MIKDAHVGVLRFFCGCVLPFAVGNYRPTIEPSGNCSVYYELRFTCEEESKQKKKGGKSVKHNSVFGWYAFVGTK